MSSSQNTTTSVNGEVDKSKISDLISGHGLIEVHCYTGIEKITWSQQMLYMIPVQQMEGVLEFWLKPEDGCVKTQLRVKWSSPVIQIPLNGRLSDHGTPNQHLRSHP